MSGTAIWKKPVRLTAIHHRHVELGAVMEERGRLAAARAIRLCGTGACAGTENRRTVRHQPARETPSPRRRARLGAGAVLSVTGKLSISAPWEGIP